MTVSGDTMDLGLGPIKVTAIRNPAELPHKDLGVDIALECTGIFTAQGKAAAHLDAGAKRVLISAPGDGADKTIVYGVNHDTLTRTTWSSPTPRAPPTAWRRSPTCCTSCAASSAAT